MAPFLVTTTCEPRRVHERLAPAQQFLLRLIPAGRAKVESLRGSCLPGVLHIYILCISSYLYENSATGRHPAGIPKALPQLQYPAQRIVFRRSPPKTVVFHFHRYTRHQCDGTETADSGSAALPNSRHMCDGTVTADSWSAVPPVTPPHV